MFTQNQAKSINIYDVNEAIKIKTATVKGLQENKEILEKDKQKNFREIAQKYNTTPEIISLIHRETEKYNLDFNIILSLVDLESNFNVRAVNHNTNGTTDRGLFQINNNTASWLAAKIGVRNITPEKIYSPKYNIKMGLWYINYLHSKYNNWYKTLTAYNKGEAGMESYSRKYGTYKSRYSKIIMERRGYHE